MPSLLRQLMLLIGSGARAAAGVHQQHQQLQLLSPLLLLQQQHAPALLLAVHEQQPHQHQHHQLQQQRGAAKKASPTSKKGAGKKGAAAPKKQKQKMESKPFDERDPLMQKLVAMLVPATPPRPRSDAEQAALQAAAKEFSRARMAEHKAWKADLNAKLALKKAALSALPPDLRAAAAAPDLTAFPLTRHYLYDSPPDAYLDK